MAEYGEGVGHATGAGKAIGGGSGGSQDLGAGVSAFVHNAVHTVQVMPPEQLLLLDAGELGLKDLEFLLALRHPATCPGSGAERARLATQVDDPVPEGCPGC